MVRRWTMLLGAVTGVALLWVSSASAAAPPLTVCQTTIAAKTKWHFDQVYGVIDGCFQAVLKGKDCSAVGLLKALDSKRATLRKEIDKKCDDADLNTLGFEEGGDLDDTTEEPGTIQIRELTDAIVLSNSRRVAEALILAYPCESNSINLGAGSGTGLQTRTSLTNLTLSGTVDICYSKINGVTGTTVNTGKHIMITRSQTLNAIKLGVDLHVCVEASGISAGFISCDGDTASKTGAFLTSTDHVLNEDGTTKVNATENLWDTDVKVCNAGPPFLAGVTLGDCISVYGGTALIKSAYWGQKSTPDCINKKVSGTLGDISCLEADSDGTTGNSSGDGNDKNYQTGGAGCNSNSNSGGAIHLADQGDTTACNGTTDVRESGLTCLGGSLVGQRCVIDADCWGATGDPGVAKCKTKTGMGTGDAVLLNTIAFKLKNPTTGDCGSDGTCCTEDDQFLGSGGSPQGLVTTTINAEGILADADATTSPALIAPLSTDCGTLCDADIDGATVSCANLAAGTPSGLILAGAFVSVDGTSFNDMVVTFSYVAP